jgi:peptidoglycan/LPS O-acetylase OafA/YrhL
VARVSRADPRIPGGYIGVDVFYVVSGFLITGLIVRELRATGRVDLSSRSMHVALAGCFLRPSSSSR